MHWRPKAQMCFLRHTPMRLQTRYAASAVTVLGPSYSATRFCRLAQVATHLTVVALLQVDSYYSSLMYTSTRTKASCPNSANCLTGDTLQPVLKSMQLLKAKLTGDAVTIAQLVESSMQPSFAECIECSKQGCINSVTTTDFRLSLPDVMPVMAGRERVSTLTAWTHAQAVACLGPFSILTLPCSQAVRWCLGGQSVQHTPTAQVWCLPCRLLTEHGPAVLAACVRCRTLDYDIIDSLSMVSQMVGPGRKSTRSFTAIELEETASITFGMNQENSKEYELRQVMIYVGSSSTGGHYTCAERMQTAECYKQDEKWRYLDSDKTPRDMSLAQLYQEHGRGVAGLLLVAKVQPGEIKGDKPVVLAKQRPRYESPSVECWLHLPGWLAAGLSELGKYVWLCQCYGNVQRALCFCRADWPVLCLVFISMASACLAPHPFSVWSLGWTASQIAKCILLQFSMLDDAFSPAVTIMHCQRFGKLLFWCAAPCQSQLPAMCQHLQPRTLPSAAVTQKSSGATVSYSKCCIEICCACE